MPTPLDQEREGEIWDKSWFKAMKISRFGLAVRH